MHFKMLYNLTHALEVNMDQVSPGPVEVGDCTQNIHRTAAPRGGTFTSSGDTKHLTVEHGRLDVKFPRVLCRSRDTSQGQRLPTLANR